MLLIGLIKPKIIKLNSRKKVLIYGLPIIFVLFISGLIVAPELTPEQRADIEQKKREKEQASIAKSQEEEREEQELKKQEKERAETAKAKPEKKEKEDPERKEKQKKLDEENKKKETQPEEFKEEQKGIEQEKRNKEKKEQLKNKLIIFDVKKVARKKQDEVNKILGKPSKVETGKWRWFGTENKTDYTMNYYKKDKIEILFIEGIAARIRLNLSNEEYFNGDNTPRNLQYLGLTAKDTDDYIMQETPKEDFPTYVYENFNNFYRVEIGLWLGSDVGFVHVITDERYR